VTNQGREIADDTTPHQPWPLNVRGNTRRSIWEWAAVLFRTVSDAPDCFKHLWTSERLRNAEMSGMS